MFAIVPLLLVVVALSFVVVVALCLLCFWWWLLHCLHLLGVVVLDPIILDGGSPLPCGALAFFVVGCGCSWPFVVGCGCFLVWCWLPLPPVLSVVVALASFGTVWYGGDVVWCGVLLWLWLWLWLWL